MSYNLLKSEYAYAGIIDSPIWANIEQIFLKHARQNIVLLLLLGLVVSHHSFAQESSSATQKDPGLATFVPKRPFNENTYNDFRCMITTTLYDDAKTLVKSSRLSLNEMNQYEVVLGDAYDSKQGKSVVVDKQVIVFKKDSPNVDDKELYILEPSGKSLEITVAMTLHKGDEMLCFKSFITVRLPPKPKP